MTDRGTERGVTLVELLVGLLFISLLAVSLHQLTRALLFGLKVLEAASEAQEAARIGVHVMMRDLRSAGFSPDRRLGNGIRSATPTSVGIVADLNGDGDCDDANESIEYSFDVASRALRRASGAAPPQPLLSDLAEDGLEFLYYDAQGAAAAALDRIRRIDLVLRIAIPHPDPNYRDPLRAEQTGSVTLRNG